MQPDPAIITLMRRLGAHSNDDKPTRIRYVTTTGADIARFFDDDPPTREPDDAVIFAVASGSYELLRGPPRRPGGPPKFSALAVAIKPDGHGVLAWGAWSDSEPDLTGLGAITDCRMTYDGDTAIPDCTRA